MAADGSSQIYIYIYIKYTETRRDGSHFIQKQEMVVELSVCGAVFPHAVTEEGY